MLRGEQGRGVPQGGLSLVVVVLVLVLLVVLEAAVDFGVLLFMLSSMLVLRVWLVLLVQVVAVVLVSRCCFQC